MVLMYPTSLNLSKVGPTMHLKVPHTTMKVALELRMPTPNRWWELSDKGSMMMIMRAYKTFHGL